MALDSNRFIVKLILFGTLVTVILLSVLLLVHDISIDGAVRQRGYVAIACIIYLLATYITYRKNLLMISSWMIVGFYTMIMCLMLISWGLNAPIGILSVAFVLFIVGILFGSRAIIAMSIGISILLGVIYFIHASGIFIPRTSEINTRATFWDAVSYIIIFSIFGLLSWVSTTRIRKTLERAQFAESFARKQRNVIRAELEDEYARSRQSKLIELERLYKFATLGQSTAATLHELSNHLSVLNMDIDDITQQHKNSAAIVRARESIEHINTMMRHVRRRLNISHVDNETFLLAQTTRLAIQDVRKKFQQRDVSLLIDMSPETKTTLLTGDLLSWSHVITILLTNACEACQDLIQPKVTLHATTKEGVAIISVCDNGIGTTSAQRKRLFQPVYSEKPNGMGVGLYIAKHLVENQFKGSIKYSSIKEGGSKFTVTVPLPNSSPRVN